LRQRLDVVTEFDGAVSTTTIAKVLHDFYRGLVVEGHVDAETRSRDDSTGIAFWSTPKIGAGEGTRVGGDLSELSRREPTTHGYTVVGRSHEKSTVIVNGETIAADTILWVHGLARGLLPDLDPRRPEHSRTATRKLGCEKEK
jgi:hypothetical protein